MKRFRPLIAFTLSLALVVLSPGSGAYHAAAQTMGSAAAGSASVSAGVSGAVGTSLGRVGSVSAIPALSPSVISLSPALSAPSILPSGTPAISAARAAAAPVAAPSALRAEGSTIISAAKAVLGLSAKAARETLKADVSVPSESETAEQRVNRARGQFDGEALRSELSAPAVGEPVAVQHPALAASAKDTDNARPSRDGGIEEIGNPRRSGPGQGGRGGSGLFRMLGMSLLGGAVAAVAVASSGPIVMFTMLLFSLILHEIGHARTANWLGDPTSRLSTYRAIDFKALLSGKWSFGQRLPMKLKSVNRGSMNPLTWDSHIDPITTLLIPALTYMFSPIMFGAARPVPVAPRFFKNPVKGMAIVAAAGPAVNAGLAVAGALAVSGAVAAGLGAGVIAALSMFVFLNVMLAIFNLIPIPGFDGSHILRLFLPYRVQAAIDGYTERMGQFSIILPMLALMVFGRAITGAAVFFSELLIGGAANVTGVELASAFLPAVAALGLVVGQLGGPAAPTDGVPAAGPQAPVDLIVMFGEKPTKLHDAHLSNINVNLPEGVEQYTRLQQAMLSQLLTAGLDAAALEPYKGTPLATYARINAATIKIDRAMIADFVTDMQDRGFKVYPNSERRIIQPVPVAPEDMDPAARGAVTMDENRKIVKADAVHAAAEKLWGKPELGFWSGLWAKAFKTKPVQPKFGIIDSGADLSHPLLKRVAEVKNMTSGENIDDIGHGSWVHSTVLHMAPWSRNTTHYKTFLDGGATLDDILRSLTQAGNDGSLVISNSWGSDDGDPKSPDSLLVQKLAQEGHIMVFAAGNAGPRKNTIGSPAIVTYKDAATGAIRVVSVAAAGRDKKIASFSSRGPGSPMTARDPLYKDQRPDLTAVGYNIEGAWPAALGDADRVDGEKGPVKAISGTSMSTPGVAGALALLAMMFGVTEVGPKLDAVVNAVMSTLEKTGQPADSEGQGFLNVDAAYQQLQAAVTADIALYKSLKSRLFVLRGLRARTGAWRYSTTGHEYYLKISAEIPEIEARLKAMESADQTLAYRAAGPVKRLFLKATGAAPRL